MLQVSICNLLQVLIARLHVKICCGSVGDDHTRQIHIYESFANDCFVSVHIDCSLIDDDWCCKCECLLCGF